MAEPAPRPRAVDYRALLKDVERVVAELDSGVDRSLSVPAIADAVICRFQEALGIRGGRLYQREGDEYVLRAIFPGGTPPPSPIRVSRSYAPVEICLEQGTVYMEPGDPRLDPELEARIGADEFAAVEVADEEMILSFDVAPGYQREAVLLSLGVVRHGVNQKLRQDRLQDMLRQAREIQASILPRRAPRFGKFDIRGRSEAIDDVGGDYFDYIQITPQILGVAIADVTGHGLPAALQVRDIYTGMRMGLSRDFKIVRTVERLNDIIHASTLTSRFVSMFYGELEHNGNFIYVNAGHPPPFHLRAADGVATFLDRGGPVLGPLPGTSFERGFVQLEPGDVLVMVTDGFTEAPRAGRAVATEPGDEHGAERLVEVVRAHLGRPAAEVLDALFASADAWSGGAPPADDRTAVVIVNPT